MTTETIRSDRSTSAALEFRAILIREPEDPTVLPMDISRLMKPHASRLALASFVLSVMSIVLWIAIDMPTPLFGALGVALGYFGLKAIRRNPERLIGRAWALGGVGIGLLNLVLVLLFLGTGGTTSGFA